MKQSFVRLTVLTAGVIILLILIACGIPSYPYLYPPEAIGGGRTGFVHDSDNDPNVFIGYEVFYRFYSTDPGAVGGGQAEQDMQLYFTSSFRISSIVYADESSSYNYGFRRAYIEPGGETPPQLLLETADINTTFTVELILDDASDNEIEFSYNGDDYFVRRSVTDSDDNHISFLGDYDYDNDSDLVASGLDELNIYVAFYAVPYGIDPETLATLYANGNSEGMEYIGSFQL